MNEWFANPLFWIAFLSLQSVIAAVIVVFGRMWPKTSMVLTMAGGLSGIAALLLLSHLTTIEDLVLVDKGSYIYEKLSLHIVLLEAFLVIVGLFFAALSFLGYKRIEEIATKQAVEIATKQAVEIATKQAVEEAMKEAIAYFRGMSIVTGVKSEESDAKLESTNYNFRPNSPEEEM